MDLVKFDDESLLRLVLRRNESALGELYDRYGRFVYSIALSSLGEPGTAEEVTQDVFLRVWERAETYQADQGKVATWLSRIARNRSIDMHRRRSIRPEANSVGWDDLTGAEPGDGFNVEQEVEFTQQQKYLRLAIQQLPEEQRQALALAYFQGFSHQEIAERLGQPLGTVKTRLRLAMQKLRVLLAE